MRNGGEIGIEAMGAGQADSERRYNWNEQGFLKIRESRKFDKECQSILFY